MTLVLDHRKALGAKPGIHLFIVGVSDYKHLPDERGPDGPPTFGLARVNFAVLSALRVYSWFRNSTTLVLPLATCRLLLSPHEDEMTQVKALGKRIQRANTNNFLQAAADWRHDACANPDSMTIFYFCGHGMQQGREDGIQLMDDFADGVGDGFSKTWRVISLYNGMAPADVTTQIARTQLYFFDCCRVQSNALQAYQGPQTAGVFPFTPNAGVDDRKAPIFYAALPHAPASGIAGEGTFFSSAIVQCLNGAASDLPDEGENWLVTVLSLVKVLPALTAEEAARNGKEQNPILGGQCKEATIVKLPGPPQVPLVFSLRPELAAESAEVKVVRASPPGAPSSIPPKLSRNPFATNVPAGYYNVSVAFPGPGAQFKDRSLPKKILGPHTEVTVDVSG